LLTLRAEEDSKKLEWLRRKNEIYTCAEAQSEMLQIMALRMLRDVPEDIHNLVYYTVMADETTDKSNREQVVFVIRHVSEDLVPHEEFIGLYKVPTVDAKTLTKTIEDCLVRMNLSLNKWRGQLTLWFYGNASALGANGATTSENT